MADTNANMTTPTGTYSLQDLFNTTGNPDMRGYGNLLGGLGTTAIDQIGESGAYPLQQQANAGLATTTNALQSLLGSGSGIAPATPWQTVENEVTQAYDQAGNINNAQQIAGDQQTLAAGMGQRGLTGSTFNQSGQVGLQNLQALLGGQTNAQGLQAGITAGQTQMNQQDTQYQQQLNSMLAGLTGLSNVSNLGANQSNLSGASNILAQAGDLVGNQQAQEIQSNPWNQITQLLTGLGSDAATVFAGGG